MTTNTKRPYLLPLLMASIILGAGCKSPLDDETHIAFSMSETMYNLCEYSVAESQIVRNEIRLFGRIEADNNKIAEVHPSVSGVVTSIRTGLGDYVKQGQVLATIQSIEVASFQKEKLAASTAVTIAEKNLQVAEDLFSGKLNSEREVALAKTELKNAEAELNRISEVHSIYNLKEGSIFDVIAPINGFVTTKKIIVNELLRSDETEALFSIADTEHIWAVAYVNESNISKIAEGQSVSVRTLAFPDEVHESTIEKIYNVIDPETKSIKIRAVIKNTDFHLKPDMNCTVTVSYPEDREMVAIPASSVIFDKNRYWAMVFKDRENIETREIEIYRQLNDIYYLKSGIEKGETVISENGLLIYDALND